MRKSLRKETILLDDWRAIHSLLKTNLALHDCIELLKNPQNSQVFSKILAELQSGADVIESIDKYLDDCIRATFTSFIKILSLEKALDLTIKIYDHSQAQKQHLIKTLLYPVLLFYFTLTGLYLFERFGLDSIFEILQSFKVDISFFAFIRYGISFFINAFYLVTMLAMVLFLIFKTQKRIVMCYILLSKYFPNNLMKLYFSQEFLGLFRICYQAGYKTKQSITILKSLKPKPVIAFLAFHVDEAFLKGATMKEAMSNEYLDNTVAGFIKLATVSNDFDTIIGRYVEVCEMKLQRMIKKYTKAIQLTVYILIGLAIIFIYQVLFLPLQALQL